MKITFIGHSAFKINDSILIDPFMAGNHTANDILLTHAHGDHLGDAIEISRKTGAKITAIFELANYCAEKGAKAQGVNIGGKVPFSWGSAYWLPARHSSSTPDGKYGGEPASIFLNINGKKIYHAGDTGLHYDMKMIGELYKPDVALLPIGGFYTMGVDEAVKAAQWLDCNKVIPMHYNTFPAIQVDVLDFKAKIEAVGKECIILKPSENVEV
ncbi:MAG: metal-dependent hydrolase [Candidatus Melainabacteria bacterium GWF2_37_15]|nr:MAG: metal-dependent hydrolase [Candidatus Melainabacteria bacterium GWF2_37_15]